MPGAYLTTPDKEKIVEARKRGDKVKDVASVFKCSPETVKKLCKEEKTTGICHWSFKTGRSPVTTPREDKVLILAHKKDPNLNASDGVRLIKHQFNKDINRKTVSRRLIHAGLMTRRPAKKPLMVAKHRKIRLDFAEKYESWTSNDWANVIFTDESKINLFNPDGNHLIRRPVGQLYSTKYLRATVKFGGGSIMLWGKNL